MAFCARQQSLLEGKRDGRAQKREESKSTQPAESMLWMLRVLEFSKGHVRQTRATTQKNTIRTHTLTLTRLIVSQTMNFLSDVDPLVHKENQTEGQGAE